MWRRRRGRGGEYLSGGGRGSGPKGQPVGGQMGFGIFSARTVLETTGATVRYTNNPPDGAPPADQAAGGHSNQGGAGARISVRWKTINAKK